ncbi:hypothetical protein AB832_07195 [Flavobacteriaceae bacterium (ex Bugula neritina AB1)]|nr:hypothetical protein AB832_07195 [Flavobacteriaceae bacterium (ex Bugula neritina AB1)]
MTKKNKDPTSTLTMRLRALADIRRRFKELKRVVIRWVLSYLNRKLLVNAEDFEYQYQDMSIDEFQEWLNRQIELIILENRGEWLTKYTRDTFKRGIMKTKSEIQSILTKSGFYNDITSSLVSDTLGTSSSFVSPLLSEAPLSNPIYLSRANLLETRVFTQLKGVTETMSSQMSTILSDGLLKGKNPRAVARELAERVDKIGITRANLIARTEMINAHNTGSILEASVSQETSGIEIKMRWLTALDGRERPTHRARHKKIYDRVEASNLIGEPNCRCSVTAFAPALAKYYD